MKVMIVVKFYSTALCYFLCAELYSTVAVNCNAELNNHRKIQ
jgi:hypothetical protein